MVLAYARHLTLRSPSFWIGHNPIAAPGVLMLLSVIAAQVCCGLFAVDVDGIESGPLSHLVSFETGRAFARGHHILFDLLCGVVVRGALLSRVQARRSDGSDGMG